MEYHTGQQVELRAARGPFQRGQVVTIHAMWQLPETQIWMFTVTCSGYRTTATADDLGAVQGEIPITEESHMTRKKAPADLPTNVEAAPDSGAGDPTPQPAAPTYTPGQLVALPLALLDADPDNERSHLGELGELKTSLREQGQEEPIQVYALPGGRFMNKSGHRRAAAAHELGWTTIQAIIVPTPATVRDQALGRLVSNLLREDMDAIKMARTLQTILAAGEVDQAALAARLGRSQPWISNTLRLLELPEPAQALITAGALTAGHGVLLLKIREPEVQYWSGRPTGRSAHEVIVRFATDAAAELASVATLDKSIKYYLQQQADGHRYAQELEERLRQDAERRAHTAQVFAQAEAQGRNPQAAVKADERAQQAAEREQAATAQAKADAKAAAERAREQAHTAERTAIARQIVDEALAYQAGAPATLDLLRLVGVMAIQATGHFGMGHAASAGELMCAINDAPDLDGVLVALARIAREGLPIETDGRRLSGHHQVQAWADTRWYLNVRIADALLAAKKIEMLTHSTLTGGKPRPPAPPTPAEIARQAALTAYQAEVEAALESGRTLADLLPRQEIVTLQAQAAGLPATALAARLVADTWPCATCGTVVTTMERIVYCPNCGSIGLPGQPARAETPAAPPAGPARLRDADRRLAGVLTDTTQAADQVALVADTPAAAEVECPNCASSFAPTAEDVTTLGEGPHLRCPFCENLFTPAALMAA